MNTNRITQIGSHQGKGYTVLQFKTPDLCQFSYYIQSNGRSLLLDPIIQSTFYNAVAANRNSKIEGVLLTHIHSDFISGHLEFEGAKIFLGDGTETKFNPTILKDSQIIQLGQIKIRSLHTPGHTFQSTSYILTDSEGVDNIIFTGDSLLIGGVGYPDLVVNSNSNAIELAGLLYQSLQKIKTLSKQLRIYPGHGFLATIGKSIADATYSTLSKQLQTNFSLKAQNKQDFVKSISTIPPSPKYFTYNARINIEGPFSYQKIYNQSNRALDVQQFDQLRKTGIIFDLRNSQQQTEKGSVKGSFLLPGNARIAQFISAIFAGQTNLLIICDQLQKDQVLQRLIRVGFVNIKGYSNFSIQDWINKGKQHYIPKYCTVQQVQNSKNRLLLDVRSKGQWVDCGILQGSRTIHYPDLQAAIDKNREEFQNKQLYIYCRFAYRARTALSIFENNGIHNSYIFPHTWTQITKMTIKDIPIVPYTV